MEVPSTAQVVHQQGVEMARRLRMLVDEEVQEGEGRFQEEGSPGNPQAVCPMVRGPVRYDFGAVWRMLEQILLHAGSTFHSEGQGNRRRELDRVRVPGGGKGRDSGRIRRNVPGRIARTARTAGEDRQRQRQPQVDRMRGMRISF